MRRSTSRRRLLLSLLEKQVFFGSFIIINVKKLTANQMRALDVLTFGYSENLRAKQWPAFEVGLLSTP